MLITWILVFIVSLVFLVKGADWLLESAEKIGLAIGLSSFIVGVVIVGIGTSFPEIITSLVASFKGVTEIVTANAIGSNIANILLVIGLSAIVGNNLKVTKSLIDIDLPLLATSTAFFLGVAWDRQVTLVESIFLLIFFGIYLSYIILYRDDDKEDNVLPARSERRKVNINFKEKKIKRPKINIKDILFLILGITGLMLGSKYLVESVIALSEILNVGAGAISLAAVALGTSLPELLVSIKAAWKHKPEVALGNIFGSNVFNVLLVIGIPGLFNTLAIDEQTFTLGIPVLVVATLLFVISGISKKIHIYEGFMYVSIYIFFVCKLFGLF